MRDPAEFIATGILELYVLGKTSEEESREVEEMALHHPEVEQEIENISRALAVFSGAVAEEPDPTLRPLILAIANFQKRLEGGEPPLPVPLLNEHSRKEDFDVWLQREDLNVKEPEDIDLRIIGAVPGAMTGILWLKHGAPYEVHHDQFERFLILEGTCDIVADHGTYSLKPGDYFSIPLHTGHSVKVTSQGACKAILQRVAA